MPKWITYKSPVVVGVDIYCSRQNVEINLFAEKDSREENMLI